MKRRKFSPVERQFVIERAGGMCEYCRSLLDYSPESFDIEHIIPLVKGGGNDLDNLALACGGCNGRKRDYTGAVDISSGKFVAFFHPRTERWEDHFVWNETLEFVTGTSLTGKVTIEALKLNRLGLVNLRKALKSVGVHPAMERK
jgi:hypothetical protein